MKKLLLLFTLAITFSCCNNDDDNPQTLPPATQTGAGTFACYVNGKPFIDSSGGYFNCFYQFIDGEYYFGIKGKDKIGQLVSISLGTIKKTISEGEILTLLEMQDGNASGGGGFLLNINSSESATTNQIQSGQLTITKLDFVNSIVSGTFYMDLINPYTNEIVEIRDGRFDTLFTQ